MKPFTLHLGDCIEVMRGMADASVDSIVTDPPYHLTSNARGSHTGEPGTPQARARIGDRGFMGQQWDGGDIAQRVELWAEALRVLKPGGHLLAFSGSRTYHRMTCAIEDAGFEVRDQIMWLYGGGMPKSRNLAKYDLQGDDATAWHGWGTALKPSHEPVCVARKPLARGLTVAANVLTHGTGAINIDACRVAFEDTPNAATNPLYRAEQGYAGTGSDEGSSSFKLKKTSVEAAANALGRWPANVVHDGSTEVVALFPESTSGAMKAGTQRAAQNGPGSVCYGTYGGNATSERIEASTGSAARFFYCAKASPSDRHAGLDDPGPQFKKGSTLRDAENLGDDRKGNHHPTVKPTDLMAYLVRLVTPPGGLVLDPFMGSGSTGKACMREEMRFIGIDLGAEYVDIARARIEHELARVIAANTPPPPPQMDLFAALTCEGDANAT